MRLEHWIDKAFDMEMEATQMRAEMRKEEIFAESDHLAQVISNLRRIQRELKERHKNNAK